MGVYKFLLQFAFFLAEDIAYCFGCFDDSKLWLLKAITAGMYYNSAAFDSAWLFVSALNEYDSYDFCSCV